MRYAIIQRAVQERHIWVEADSPSEAMAQLRGDRIIGAVDDYPDLDCSDFATIKITYRRDPSEDYDKSRGT